jgi:protein-tyrosine phosphatase
LRTGADAPRLFFVCTANRCRSPFAEAIARRSAGRRAFVFASAGLLPGGFPVPPNGLQVAAERGLPLSGHRSTQLDAAALQGWDVVLTMSRDHAREIVAVTPDLWPRVFTLRQFRRALQAKPPRRHVALGPWIDETAAGRSRLELIGRSPDDDVADPLTAPVGAWRDMADLLQDEIAAVLDLISPP